MIVGPAGNDVETALGERHGQRPGVGDDLCRIALEAGIESLAKTDGLGGNHVLERAALRAGEERLVDCLRVRGARENEATTRTTQRLVSRRCDGFGMGHRWRM